MKKLLSLFLVSALLLSIMIVVGVSAEVTEPKIKLVDTESGNAPGFGSGHMHLGWANNAGMRFDILDDEILTGVDIRTITPNPDEKVNITLYKWNTNLDDKEALETKDFIATDWAGNVYTFEKVYPKGTYYVEIKTFKAPEPRVYVYNKVITGRNIQAYQYNRTWQEFNEAKIIENGAWFFGEGFDMDIMLLKGVSANAQKFVAKYNEAKAEGVTIHNQAKYDAVMTAVGTDLKAFLKNTSEANITTHLNNLNASLTEPATEPATNPTTGDTQIALLIIVSAAFAVVIMKKKVRV